MSTSGLRRRRTTVALAAAGALALVAALPTQASGADKPAAPGKTQMNVQLLSFNDFHGNLEPPTGSSGVTTTGYTEGPLTDSSGKPILNPDGSPKSAPSRPTSRPEASPISPASCERCERVTRTRSPWRPVTSSVPPRCSRPPSTTSPRSRRMNELGLEVTSVGNHEFDEGYQELQRMQNGGCIDDGDGANNQNSCPDGTLRRR